MKFLVFLFILSFVHFEVLKAQTGSPFLVEDDTLPIANSRFDDALEPPSQNFTSKDNNDLWEKFERGEVGGKAFVELQNERKNILAGKPNSKSITQNSKNNSKSKAQVNNSSKKKTVSKQASVPSKNRNPASESKKTTPVKKDKKSLNKNKNLKQANKKSKSENKRAPTSNKLPTRLPPKK